MAGRERRIAGAIADIIGAPTPGVIVSATLTGGARYRDTVAGKDIMLLTRSVVTASGVALPAPVVSGTSAVQSGTGSLADAVYHYRISDEPQGVETAVSAAIAVTVNTSGANTGAVVLSGLPAPAAASLGRVVYRAQGATPADADYHYLTTLLDPTQTSYSDTASQSAVSAQPAMPTAPMAAGSWRIAVVAPGDIIDLENDAAVITYQFSVAGQAYETTAFAYDDGSPLAFTALQTTDPGDAGTMTPVFFSGEDIIGAALGGSLTIQLSFDARSTDSHTYFYGGAPRTFPLVRGGMTALLKPNSLLVPTGSFYRIRVNGGPAWEVVIPPPDPGGHPDGFDLDDPAILVGSAAPGQVKYNTDSIAATAEQDTGLHPPITLTQDLANVRERIAYMQAAPFSNNIRLARNPTTVDEDLLVRRGGQLIRLPKGGESDVLGIVSSQVAYITGVIRNPMTAAGALIIGSTGGLPVELPIGADGDYLRTISGAPVWHTIDTEAVSGPAPAFAGSSTAATHSPDVAVPTEVDDLSVTLTVPADTQYLVSVTVLLTKGGGNSIRLGLEVDGTLVYPDPANGVAIWGVDYDPAGSAALSWPALVGLEAGLNVASFTTLITLTTGSRTVAVVWEAALGTEDIVFFDRALSVVPAVAPGPINPMLALDDLILGGGGGTPLRKPVGVVGDLLAIGGDGRVDWLSPSLAGLFVNPMTAEDDLIRGGTSGLPARLAVGSPGDLLHVGGDGHLAYIDAAAVVSSGGGGGGMTNPMTALDQLIVGGTAGSPVALDPGSIGQVVGIDSTGHIGYINQTGGGGGSGMANPMTTLDDVIVGGAAGSPVRLAVGSEGQVLGVVSGHVAYLTPSAAGMTNPMTAVGDLIVGGSGGAATRLAAGTTNNGKVLTVVAGVPAYQTLPSTASGLVEAYLVVTANHTMDGTKKMIFVDASSTNIAITLVSAGSYDGQTFKIKRTDSSTHTVTIATLTPAVNGFIDNASSITIPTQNTSWSLFAATNNWWLV